jgi:hypothetical protein
VEIIGWGIILVVSALCTWAVLVGKKKVKSLLFVEGVWFSIGMLCIYYPNITAFNSPMGRIETEAKSSLKSIQEIEERVEGVESSLIAMSSQAAERLRGIEQVQNSAEAKLAEISEASDFSMLVSRARNDSRSAFEDLLTMSRDEGARAQAEADEAIRALKTEMNAMINLRVDPMIPWAEGQSISSIPSQQLQSVLNSLDPIYHPRFLSELWESEAHSTHDKLALLATYIESSSSIRGLQRACFLMDKEAHLKKNFIAYQKFLDWWKANGEKFRK